MASSYGAAASAAIGLMNTAVLGVKGKASSQNDNLEKILNLDKKNLLELKKGVFMTKQRNELILNSWHIEATKEQ